MYASYESENREIPVNPIMIEISHLIDKITFHLYSCYMNIVSGHRLCSFAFKNIESVYNISI